MKFTVDCKIFNAKKAFLAEMRKIFEGMYSLNYDAFIDGARVIDEFTEIEIKNIDFYEDEKNLKEILEIIEKENPQIKFITD